MNPEPRVRDDLDAQENAAEVELINWLGCDSVGFQYLTFYTILYNSINEK